jgi:hypothetical protein
MTVTRGATPRGLPYPGSNEPDYNVPAFLQQLADAVQAQLSTAGAGTLLVTWSGNLTTNTSGFIFPVMPGLKIVRGALVGANGVSGGTGPWLYYLSPTSWTDQNSWGKAVIGVCRLVEDAGKPGYPGVVKSTSVGVSVIAWGDPP